MVLWEVDICGICNSMKLEGREGRGVYRYSWESEYFILPCIRTIDLQILNRLSSYLPPRFAWLHNPRLTYVPNLNDLFATLSLYHTACSLDMEELRKDLMDFTQQQVLWSTNALLQARAILGSPPGTEHPSPFLRMRDFFFEEATKIIRHFPKDLAALQQH